MSADDERSEARVLEYNAAQGVRTVVVVWLTRRFVLPLTVLLLLVPVMALVVNGPIAGLLAAALVALPLYLLWSLTLTQWAGIRAYLRGYRRR